MSKYSPRPVGEDEMLAMFAFKPIQIDKKGRLKPGLFDHAFKEGRSIQRDSIATEAEIFTFVSKMLDSREDFVWKGLVLAKCHAVRDIKIENSAKRAACVYDTANKENPAHGEICQTQHIIDEADRIELRHDLLAAFGNGEMAPPMQYRNGTIWSKLPENFRARE